jgi:hypothetical protein
MIVDGGQSMDDLAGLLTDPEPKKPAKEPAAGEHEAPEGDKETPGADEGDADAGEDGNPDGTDAGDAEHEEGAADDEAGEGEGTPEPFYTVKIDGKEERVTLKEALDGYQRNSDYTRKTQEVAKARTDLDAELAGARAQRSEYANVLKVLNGRLGDASAERTEDQWNALRASDPTKYATEWTDFQRRTEQRNAIKAEQDRIAREQQTEDTNKFKVYLNGERTKLQAAMPVLKDPVKGPKEIQALREYARDNFGYSDAELERAYDHRLLLIVNTARKWTNHEKALAAAKQKVAAAPDLPEPGSRTPPVNKKAKARADQMKTLDRTGKLDDALGLILG